MVKGGDMKSREEALAEARKASDEHRRQAKTLKAEGLSNPAIARAMNISDTPGLCAKAKVENLLK
jgi:DNA-binding NarL/FixJ family response regulator